MSVPFFRGIGNEKERFGGAPCDVVSPASRGIGNDAWFCGHSHRDDVSPVLRGIGNAIYADDFLDRPRCPPLMWVIENYGTGRAASISDDVYPVLRGIGNDA